MVTISKLPNGNVRVHVECRLRSGAVRQYFETSEGDGLSGDSEDVPFVQELARSLAWKELMMNGTYSGKTALASALGVCRRSLRRTLQLSYLSPVIVERAINGELADCSIMRCRSIAYLSWYEQHRALGIE